MSDAVSSARPSSGWTLKAALVAASGAVIVAIAMGTRQSFGIFLTPVSMELSVGRETFALAIAVQNLMWGLAQPFVGAIADRFGAVRVTIVGAVLYALGLVLAGASQSGAGLTLTFGGLIGLALSCTTYVTVLGAVGRAVPAEKRSIAFGITTAAGSFGMFAVVPGAQALLDSVGWREALILLAIGMSIVAAAAFGLRTSYDGRKAGGPQAAGLTVSEALRAAARHPSYWLLLGGFFVCGFHLAFVATHLPAYLADQAISAEVAAGALALIGLFNIAGSLTFGALGGRMSKKAVLSAIYGLRALAIALFVIFPLSPTSALMFSAAIGFLWLGTVPLTSGLCAQMFGVRSLSTIYGIVFLSHQVGSFLGAWLGGLAFDALGSYDSVWMASIALGVFAAAIHWPIDERPVRGNVAEVAPAAAE